MRPGSAGMFTAGHRRRENAPMQYGKVFRFGPTPEHAANHLFVFLHGSGATAQSMIPAAFKFQARFPSAALVVPSGFARYENDLASQQWYSTRGLNDDNRLARITAILPPPGPLGRGGPTKYGPSLHP